MFLSFCSPASSKLTSPITCYFSSTLVAMAKELFDVVQSGVVKININQTYPLKDVSKAHRDLEARKTTGSTVLTI